MLLFSPESCVHTNESAKSFSAGVHQKNFCDIKRIQFSLVFLLRGLFPPTLRRTSDDDTVKMNIKLKIGKNIFWHIEWSLTGQLRSDFQSKPKFIKSFSRQTQSLFSLWALKSSKWKIFPLIFSEKNFSFSSFNYLQIMRIQSKLIRERMLALTLTTMIFQWWVNSTIMTRIQMTWLDLEKSEGKFQKNFFQLHDWLLHFTDLEQHLQLINCIN